ncbi:MAG TPA: hypothetical protein VNM92_15245 [Thermoanaerobaculia bacterium]|nr:hypothetical protein [Thermoanaerobaculia bacterium]
MYKYVVGFALVMPLYGIWLMERGAFGWSVGRVGYPNGAAKAFALYSVVLATIAWLIARRAPATNTRQVTAAFRAPERLFRRFSVHLMPVQLMFLGVLLFGFGGIDVWTGVRGKGEFRVGLGTFGAVAFMLIKYVIPALFAYAAYLYRTCRSSSRNRLLLFTNGALAFICGTVWGYKATPISVLLPGLLLLFWRIGLRQMVWLGALVAGSFVALFHVFDSSEYSRISALEFLWIRLTVLQGDVSWEIWDQYRSGALFPPYLRTLTPFLGNRVFSLLTGLSASKFSVWMEYQYGFLLTYLAGVPLDLIEAGYTVTGTPFAEGLIAAGLYGAMAFAVLGGIMTGLLYYAIAWAIARRRAAAAAILATYFCWCVFPWLVGGGVVTFFHLSVFAGLFGAYLCIAILRGGLVTLLTRKPASAGTGRPSGKLARSHWRRVEDTTSGF